ncbi:hypothetical protein VTN02DRAFT_672 [Thermoascus thermophilus]
MSSASSEEHPPALEAEDQPLLGRPGGATQAEGVGVQHNLITGSAIVAQAGVWILVALVWSAVLSKNLVFFSAHPLLNSAAVLLQVQAILTLQPTHTPRQKTLGTRVHAGLHALSSLGFVAALVVVEISKKGHPRLASPHAVLGVVTYVGLALQALVGVVQYFLPAQLLGSVDRGRSIYRYHRLGGYVLLLLELATVSAATQTVYNAAVLHIRLWAVLLASILVVLGVAARIKKRKLGL